jgi:hypothetical protein
MQPDGSLPCSQVPITGPYIERHESSRLPYFFNIYITIVLSSNSTTCPQLVSFLQACLPKLCTHISSLTCMFLHLIIKVWQIWLLRHFCITPLKEEPVTAVHTGAEIVYQFQDLFIHIEHRSCNFTTCSSKYTVCCVKVFQLSQWDIKPLQDSHLLFPNQQPSNSYIQGKPTGSPFTSGPCYFFSAYCTLIYVYKNMLRTSKIHYWYV